MKQPGEDWSIYARADYRVDCRASLATVQVDWREKEPHRHALPCTPTDWNRGRTKRGKGTT